MSKYELWVHGYQAKLERNGVARAPGKDIIGRSFGCSKGDLIKLVVHDFLHCQNPEFFLKEVIQ